MKRVIDFFIAFFGIILLSPVFMIVMMVLFVANKGTPFFFQKRPGMNERIFKIIKFKTMNDKKDGKGDLLPDAERLTKVGDFIRKTSLDEIPQLINILKGDMSLIGPRPLRIRYLPRYNKFQKQRHFVKPGITGWAQINGRNTIPWAKKFELDVYYVNHLSFSLDSKILFFTVKKVFRREGIKQEGKATVEEFRGDN
jgi:lipopolysaccharide/colanic/teichoic acid biosynthesis glycosyltransferase